MAYGLEGVEDLQAILGLLTPLKIKLREELPRSGGGYVLHDIDPNGDFTVKKAGNYDALIYLWDGREMVIQKVSIEQRFLVAGDSIHFNAKEIADGIYKMIEMGVFAK